MLRPRPGVPSATLPAIEYNEKQVSQEKRSGIVRGQGLQKPPIQSWGLGREGDRVQQQPCLALTVRYEQRTLPLGRKWQERSKFHLLTQPPGIPHHTNVSV